MPYGFCDAAAYLNCGDTDKVVAELVSLFAAEGMVPIERPAQHLNHESPLSNNLWAIIVFPGNEGWTVVKHVPWELLCDRAKGAERNRFFELCKRLAVPGVLLAAHDGPPAFGKVIAEVDGAGRERVCGWWYHERELEGLPQGAKPECRFYGHRVHECQTESMTFELLPHLQTVLHDSRNRELCEFRADDAFEIFFQYFGAQMGGRNDNCLNRDGSPALDYTMTRGGVLTVPDGVLLYFGWPAGDRPQPQPNERDLAVERLLKEPRVFYADGSPVLIGDAVLFDRGIFPGFVTGFMVANMGEELRVTSVMVRSVEPGDRCEDASTAAAQLQLVERNSRDFLKSGVDWLRRHARKGDAKSQFALGNLYLIGYGIPKDQDECLRWWRMAAAQGYAPAVQRLDED